MKDSPIMSVENAVRFVPSEVEGVDDLAEVVVYPDRLELISCSTRVIPFVEIARWNRFGWWYKSLAKLGWGIHGSPCVADRDWFHPPSRRFFRFYTNPVITIYLADEPNETPYALTLFRRIQNVLAAGGFYTFDLG